MEMARGHPKNYSSMKLLSLEENDEDTDVTHTSVKRTQSHDQLPKFSARESFIRRTKSLSAYFLFNTDEPLNSAVSGQQCPHLDPGTDQSLGEGIDSSDSYGLKNIQLGVSLPISLKFQDVKYKVEMKGSTSSMEEQKYILQGVSGTVQPGEVLALIGPSGGGKTTLLNLLSGRVKFDSGSITYNDQPYTKSLRRRIGYVLQDDLVFPHLTVKETLTYAALLRLPNTLTREQKKERAMDVISDLGLERCQNTLIGGGCVQGISGGERKRVCIGNEVLLNPSLLFLDEPTSSLDSSTALRIVQMLHAIAKSGKTVVTTIHQPSSRLFTKFDKLILLGRGSSLYSGKACEAMFYFNSIGCSPLIAMNPAEFLIDLANGNIKDKSIPLELKNKLSPKCSNLEIADTKPSSTEVQEYLVGIHEAKSAKTIIEELDPETVSSQFDKEVTPSSVDWGATWWEQFSVLSSRAFKEKRHEHLSLMRIMQVIAIALVIGSLWWHSNSSPKELQDHAGLLFFISVFWGFLPLFTAVFTFPQERAMLTKERSVGLYKLSAYYAARSISDILLDLLLPVPFILIVYFMAGLKLRFSVFCLTTLTIFFSIIAAQGLGFAIGAAFMDVKKAMTLASVILMTFMLAGGFFTQNVPSFMSWVRYLSFNYHTYKLLLKIQYGCRNGSSVPNACRPPAIRGITLDSGATEVAALAAMVIGYRLLAYLLLWRMKLRITP